MSDWFGENIWWVIVGVIVLSWGWFYNFENPLDYYGENSKVNIKGGAYYGFPYYERTPITFSTFDCQGDRRNRITEALNIIQTETDGIVKFEEDFQGYGDIKINCLESYGTFDAAGYGGPTLYESGSIDEGTIDLYKHDSANYIRCESYPVIEIHEILHAFGIDHINNINSLMYGGVPVNACTKIDTEIVECLKSIYTNGERGLGCEGIPIISYYS